MYGIYIHMIYYRDLLLLLIIRLLSWSDALITHIDHLVFSGKSNTRHFKKFIHTSWPTNVKYQIQTLLLYGRIQRMENVIK